ncbi:hypothetical protein XENOCAPTIV_008605, partial [Xenoophorus captivus]
ISDAEWEDMLEGFDERSYLNARRWKPGDDPYTLYAFNQRESERIPSDRALRDTRHYSWLQDHISFRSLKSISVTGTYITACICCFDMCPPDERLLDSCNISSDAPDAVCDSVCRCEWFCMCICDLLMCVSRIVLIASIICCAKRGGKFTVGLT